jgi:hypothetical protein
MIIIIIVTVTKSYSVYMKYYCSKEGEKIIMVLVLVRILMSKSGFKDNKVLIKLIVGVVKHDVTIVVVVVVSRNVHLTQSRE